MFSVVHGGAWIGHLHHCTNPYCPFEHGDLYCQHSPDFRKQKCGERVIWIDPDCFFKQFSTVFFQGRNSWIELLFYFFPEHRLKTLNKEEYNLTHVIKNTHGLAYVAFSYISSRLWSGDNTIWRILSIKEIYQVFI